jgi:archaellum component FlaC
MSGELDRHTIEVQDKIINELRDEIERLREEVKDLQSVIRSYRTGFADEQ